MNELLYQLQREAPEFNWKLGTSILSNEVIYSDLDTDVLSINIWKSRTFANYQYQINIHFNALGDTPNASFSPVYFIDGSLALQKIRHDLSIILDNVRTDVIPSIEQLLSSISKHD